MNYAGLACPETRVLYPLAYYFSSFSFLLSLFFLEAGLCLDAYFPLFLPSIYKCPILDNTIPFNAISHDRFARILPTSLM